MDFYDRENIRRVTAGRWLQRGEPIDARRGTPRAEGVAIDSRGDVAGKIFVAVRGARHDGHDHAADAAAAGATMVVVERAPAAPVAPTADVLRVDDTRRALGRLARAYRRTLPAVRVIAITGSAGKTTTKELVHAALQTRLRGSAAPGSFNNDIGVPLTMFGAKPADHYLVVEIGTNAPGEVGALGQIAEPDVAVITLAGRSHLEGLGTEEAVAREKLALAACLRPGGQAVVNADCEPLRAVARSTRSVVLYGESPDAQLRLTDRGADADGWWIEVNRRHRFRLGLPGRHNALNALAAVAVGWRMGLDDEAIDAGLATVSASPMRMGKPEVGALRVYNDAYNANPESMNAALETFVELEGAAPRRVVVLGDMLELGGAAPQLHERLAERLIELDDTARIDHVVLVGTLAGHTARVLRERWDPARVERVRAAGPRSRDRIVALLRPGDAVLVKGSRALALERLVPQIESQVAGPGASGKPGPDGTPTKRRSTKKKKTTKKRARGR